MSEKKKEQRTEHRFPKPDDCAICFESMKDVVEPMACGHWFHKACVKKQFKPKCAVCRAVLPIEVKGERPKNAIYQQGFVDGMVHGISFLRRTSTIINRWDPADHEGDYSIPAYGPSFIPDEDGVMNDEYSVPNPVYGHTDQCDSHYCFCEEIVDDEPGSDEENPHGDDWHYEYV